MNRWSIVFIVAVLIGFAGVARAAEEQPRTISTSGESTVYVVPDEVVISVGVATLDPSLDRAKQINDEQSAKLLKAVKGLEIQDKQIQTQDMAVAIRYKHDSPMEIDGYYITRQYAVTLKEPKKLEALVTAALKNGGNQMYGVEYRTSELRKHRDQARSMAIKAAKEKAVDLARELECEVGRPRTIGESSWGYWGPASRWGGNSWMTQNSAQQQSSGGEGGETMPLGQIGIKATVSVTFDLAAR